MRVTSLIALVALASPVLAQDPVISEFLADNDDGILDVDGDSSDWIELHNPGSSSIDLGGWHLTDDESDPLKWTFPSSVWIAPGGFMLVFASAKDRTDPLDELHTNFRLASAGEYFALHHPTGSFASTEFAPSYSQQYEDVSYGFEFAPTITGNEYYFHTPTPGSANTAPGPLILDVASYPEEPGDDDEVVVSAAVIGALGGSGFVQLEYVVMFESSQSVAMLEEAAGAFTEPPRA